MSGEKKTFLTSRQRRTIRNNLTGYAFIIPNLIGYTIFVFIPVIFSFVLSVMSWDGSQRPMEFVGMANFVDIFGDKIFRGTLVHTVSYALMTVAPTLVLALLGERWMGCVPYLRIMCVAYSFWPIHITNLQAINAAGRSDMFLKLEIVKKTMGLCGLFAGMCFGPLVLISVKAGLDFLTTFVNAWPNKKLLGYGIFSQWADILPSAGLSFVMCAAVYGAGLVLPGGPWIKLILQVAAGAGLYVCLAAAFRMESFLYMLGLIKSRKREREA